MRITLHLDTFERLCPNAWGIVWIDKEAGKWSREAHAGLALPQWGRYRSTQGSTWLAAGEDGPEFCRIEGLDLAAAEGPFEGEHGRVQWHGGAQEPAAGNWHVQCVDETVCTPEDGLFADQGETRIENETEDAIERLRIA